MATILDQIVAEKKREIKRLYETVDAQALRQLARPSSRSFYKALSAARRNKQPFFIAEFKRKSPSEGWINNNLDVSRQVQAYAAAGAGAVSVLTDTPFFGGSYEDLRQAAEALQAESGTDSPLILQKDFILDPIQIYLARLNGAHIILLIAAILPPERLAMLQHLAEQLGMGVLVEVHDQQELDRIRHLDFPVLGINNRDLKTFRTALNRVNALARLAGSRFLIAESGLRDYRDFRVAQRADGFLIGTSLMRPNDSGWRMADGGLAERFRRSDRPFLFKACGIRTPELLDSAIPDFIGLNFSPVSTRRIEPALLEGRSLPGHAVAVFYQNSEEEIREILARHPFQRVQLYAGDVSPAFVRSLRQKVLLACRVATPADLERLEAYAADVDLFILDGAVPGSGKPIEATVPADFPYPFLLAGGMHAGNLDRIRQWKNCIGVDVASGIETEGTVDENRMEAVRKSLAADIFTARQNALPSN